MESFSSDDEVIDDSATEDVPIDNSTDTSSSSDPYYPGSSEEEAGYDYYSGYGYDYSEDLNYISGENNDEEINGTSSNDEITGGGKPGPDKGTILNIPDNFGQIEVGGEYGKFIYDKVMTEQAKKIGKK